MDCGQIAQPLDWRCTNCEGVLDFEEYPTFIASLIQEDDFTLWRYAQWLPTEKQFSLGEGMTPLVETTIDGQRLLAKLEYLNPTGSYKDRGTVTMMNHIAAQGVTEVVEDSSGNAGASVAAYSSAMGIKARIYVPESGSPAKKGLIKAFGGTLMEIAGAQHAKTEAAMEAAKETPYASHAWSPYFVLGQMTVAFEVWEQTRGNLPDIVVTPLGHGGLFLGFARGFELLHEASLIDKLPKMVAVQSEHCDPIVQAWQQGLNVPPRIQSSKTVADGIIVDVPVRGKEVLAQIRKTGGAAFNVTDEQVIDARDKLAKQGLIAEPTSATTIAALPQINRHFGDNQRILVALTGNGLKGVG